MRIHCVVSLQVQFIPSQYRTRLLKFKRKIAPQDLIYIREGYTRFF